MPGTALALALSAALAGPHAEHRAEAEALGLAQVARPTAPALLPDVTAGPDRIVYGYEPYWNANLQTVPWDQLSHLAIFSADAASDGSLVNTSRFDRAVDAVAIAEAYGVRVHLCVTNFDSGSLSTLLGSATNRQRLIDGLVAQVARTGAHGVNVDFENLPSSRKAEMVQFVRDLDAVVEDVVLATPAVDWSGAWDYDLLAANAHLFIMGYGYHWSGSESAGPVDPLWGGAPWSQYSLDWSVQDYLDNGAPAGRIILGLPLYGTKWPVSSHGVPAPTSGRGSSIVFSTAWDEAATAGAQYDGASETPYYDLGANQTWYGHTDSVRERIAYAKDEGLGGFGFWAIHYTGDDPAFWRMVDEETSIPLDPEEPEEDAPLIANAGRPFLAYVGDTVILTAEASRVPEAGATYEWTQEDGPAARLAGADEVEASFVVEQAGVHVFALRVGDGEAWSAPDRTHVVVLDRRVGRHYAGCGWPGPPVAGWWLAALAAPLVGRRRR
jgi:spore germination protein YaaH